MEEGIQEVYKFNKYQTPLTEELKASMPKEVWQDLLEYIDSVPFINWLVQPEEIRGFAKDRPKDSKGRIIVDLTKPHILEDMDYFRPAAKHYEEHGCYTFAVANPNPKSKSSLFWTEEVRRWKHGYVRESDGEWITGGHYFYLNYCPIWINEVEEKTEKSTKFKGKRVRKFPRFWHGDYLFFHYFEQAKDNGNHVKVLKTRGVGAAGPNSEPILTPTGFKTYGDIQVGDMLIDRFGMPTKVTDVFPQGKMDIYEVTLMDGRKTRCTLNHNWSVFDKSRRYKEELITYSLEKIISKGLKWTNKAGNNLYKFFIPDINPVIYTEKKLPVGPYALGALLGDGSMSTKTIKIASCDKDKDDFIPNFLDSLGEGFYCSQYDKNGVNFLVYDSIGCECIMYHGGINPVGKNRLIKALEDLNLRVTTSYKFIPDIYKYSSINQRLELIKGLMDTDGSINEDGNLEFSNSNEKLIDDVAEVLRSLGIQCSKGLGRPPHKKIINNKECNIKQEYRLYIRTNECLFKLKRKVDRCRSKNIRTSTAIVAVEKLNYEEEATCFIVDNPEHIYLTKDYIPTHNSFKLGSLSPRNMYIEPGLPNFHLASDATFLDGDKGVFGKIQDNLNWIALNTPLPRKRIVDSPRSREIQLGYKDINTGVSKGLKSSVYAISLKDNPDKARGIRGPLIHYEEDGLFPNLETAWNINRKAVEDGDISYGVMCSLGTGGVTGASFEGSEKLFRNPLAYNIYGLPNIYEKNSGKGLCGFFWGAYINRALCYDEVNGESDVIKALIEVLKDRYIVKYNSTDPQAITQKRAEEPIVPSEAMLKTTGTIFPVSDLKDYRETIALKGLSYYKTHYVGELVYRNGLVEWVPNDDKFPIRKYPTGTDKPEGCLEIFEMPKKDSNGVVDKYRYCTGCLLSGEQVMTDKGLMNVQDVTYSDKLINQDGELVSPKALLSYDKENEDIYTVTVGNTYRTTSFTKEHPILFSHPKKGYVSKNRCKQEGIKQRYFKFDFTYKTVDNLKINDWIKVPNIYKRENPYSYEHLWDEETTRIDFKIASPLNNEDFWWFVGLWLGDGWCTKNNIYIAFNSKEIQYIEKCKNTVEKLFNRVPRVLVKDNCTYISFRSKQLSSFLTNNFGKYASGKYISEWAKYINNSLKLKFIQGYLNSDGCITKNKNKYYSMEFVSINLRLLEDFQDILFSIGIISSIKKLRNAQIHYIRGKYVHSKITYSLAITHSNTLTLVELLNDYTDTKISKIDFNNLPKLRTNLIRNLCFFDETKDYIYFKVIKIEKSSYTGKVYNFECDTHTFMCHHITTHNCDPVDDDSSTTDSLVSIFVYDLYTERIVAEYTGRPKFAKEYYELCRRLCLFYNCKLMYENNKKGLFAYFDQYNSLYLLADTPTILVDKEMIKGIGYGNKSKGIPATKGINAWGRRLQRDWLLEPSPIQDYDDEGNQLGVKLNMHNIRSTAYIDELIAWNEDINCDRVSAMGILMIYREELLKNLMVKDSVEEKEEYDAYLDENYKNVWKADNSYDDNFYNFTA